MNLPNAFLHDQRREYARPRNGVIRQSSVTGVRCNGSHAEHVELTAETNLIGGWIRVGVGSGFQVKGRGPTPASMHHATQEMPSIRFRTPKPPDMDSDEAPVLEARSLVSQRIAAELDAILSGYQASGLLPQGLYLSQSSGK